MKNYLPVILAGGIVVAGGYLIYQSTSQPTDETGGYCNQDWTDYFNPLCWFSGLTASAQNTENSITNELNTVLLILGAIVVLVVALLAFGPQTSHIAGAASRFALL